MAISEKNCKNGHFQQKKIFFLSFLFNFLILKWDVTKWDVTILAAHWDIKFMHADFWDRVVPAQKFYRTKFLNIKK